MIFIMWSGFLVEVWWRWFVSCVVCGMLLKSVCIRCLVSCLGRFFSVMVMWVLVSV